MFNKLPAELMHMLCVLLEGAYETDIDDLLAFSKVCRRTREFANEVLFPRIRYMWDASANKLEQKTHTAPWGPRGTVIDRPLNDKDIAPIIEAVKTFSVLRNHTKCLEFSTVSQWFGSRSELESRPTPTFTIFDELRESFASLNNLREVIINLRSEDATRIKSAWQNHEQPLFPRAERLTTDHISIWLNEQCPSLRAHKVIGLCADGFENMLTQVCKTAKLEEFHYEDDLCIDASQIELVAKFMPNIKRLGFTGPMAIRFDDFLNVIKGLANLQVITLPDLNFMNVDKDKDRPRYNSPGTHYMRFHWKLRENGGYHFVARRLFHVCFSLKLVEINSWTDSYDVLRPKRNSHGRRQEMECGWRPERQHAAEDITWIDPRWLKDTSEKWMKTQDGMRFVLGIGAGKIVTKTIDKEGVWVSRKKLELSISRRTMLRADCAEV